MKNVEGTSPVVLLTAAIVPAPGVEVSVADVERRGEQYVRSFTEWGTFAARSRLEPRICVVESSGSDPSMFSGVFANLPAARIDWVSYRVTGGQASRGKGAIEAAMIDHALSTSSFFQREETTVFKATGRIGLANPEECVEVLKPQTVRARHFVDRSRVDMRLVGARVGVWKRYLSGLDQVVDESQALHLGNAVAARIAGPVILHELHLERFKQRPGFRGVSGTNGRRYGTVRHRLAESFAGPVERSIATLAAWKSI